MDRIRAALDLRPGEGAAVAWGGLMFFAILASYFVLRPVRDALVLDGDMAFIPVLFSVSFVAMIALAQAWGAVVARWSRARFVPIVYRFFLVHLLGFFVLVRAGVAGALGGAGCILWVCGIKR
jgi:AAA family ATP:ADP antiporter